MGQNWAHDLKEISLIVLDAFRPKSLKGWLLFVLCFTTSMMCAAICLSAFMEKIRFEDVTAKVVARQEMCVGFYHSIPIELGTLGLLNSSKLFAPAVTDCADTQKKSLLLAKGYEFGCCKAWREKVSFVDAAGVQHSDVIDHISKKEPNYNLGSNLVVKVAYGRETVVHHPEQLVRLLGTRLYWLTPLAVFFFFASMPFYPAYMRQRGNGGGDGGAGGGGDGGGDC